MVHKDHFLRGHLLLVTTDEAMIRKIRMDIQGSLLELHTALSADIAVERLAAYPIDILLVDLETDDAVRLLARVSLKYTNVYPIVVTDRGAINSTRPIISRNLARKYLTKPVKSSFIKRHAPQVIADRNKREFRAIIEAKDSVNLLPCSRKVYPALRTMAYAPQVSTGSLANDIALCTALLHSFYTDPSINMSDATATEILDTCEQDDFDENGYDPAHDEFHDMLDELFYTTVDIDTGQDNSPESEHIVQKRMTSSITYAMLQMGVEKLREIMDSMELVESYDPGDYYHFRRISMKSVLIRRFVPTVHRALYYNPVSPKMGLPLLMIDIGRLFQLAHMPDVHEAVAQYMKTHRDMGCYSVEIELGLEGRTHMDIGAILFEKWGFPPLFSMLVRHHHTPRRAKQKLRTLLAAIAYTDTFIDFLINESRTDGQNIDITKFKYYKKFPHYDLRVMSKKMLEFMLHNSWV